MYFCFKIKHWIWKLPKNCFLFEVGSGGVGWGAHLHSFWVFRGGFYWKVHAFSNRYGILQSRVVLFCPPLLMAKTLQTTLVAFWEEFPSLLQTEKSIPIFLHSCKHAGWHPVSPLLKGRSSGVPVFFVWLACRSFHPTIKLQIHTFVRFQIIC